MKAIDGVEKNFRDWACSLSGCDGGDPSSPVWLCGIEWGFAKKSGQSEIEYEEAVKNYYKNELRQEISNGKCEPQKTYDWNDSLTYPFGKGVAKLFMAINGKCVQEYKNVDREYPGKSLFKLNLYPVPFRYTHDELWTKYGVDQLSGLKSKEAYRVWCFLNRFPSIAETVEQRNPQLIVGTGISYLVDFFACFAGNQGSRTIHVDEVLSDNKSKRRYYWSYINEGKTLLAVVPFFSGQYGLNSNNLIEKVGSKLRELLKQSGLTF